jgi:hypothetical protein
LKVYNQGKRLYSNFGGGDGDYKGKEDLYNNVEKITIDTSDLTVGTTLMVVVETYGLAYASSQNFSVVVTGNLGEGSPVLAPTPSPTTATQAPTVNDGYCVSGSSVVKVLSAGMPVDTKLTEVKVGDKVLSRSLEGEHVYATVNGLPNSATVQPFVHITMGSAGSTAPQVKVTPHHTFPACSGHMVEAHKVKKGDCLLTVDGESRVKETKFMPVDHLGAEDALTYTLVMGDDIESVAVGGVFTHARTNAHTHADVAVDLAHHSITKGSIKRTNKAIDAQINQFFGERGEEHKSVSFTTPKGVHVKTPKMRGGKI